VEKSEGKKWSGRKDLNLRPPGPEPSQWNAKPLNRRRITVHFPVFLGYLLGYRCQGGIFESHKILDYLTGRRIPRTNALRVSK
jgi:hypothetical protein